MTHLNFELLNLVNQVSSEIELAQIEMSNKKLSLYRNYFIQKAIAAANIENANYALQALKFFKDDVMLQTTHHNIYLKDGNK